MAKLTEKKWTVRLPEALQNKVKKAAIEHHRSMNGMLVYILEYYFDSLTPRHKNK